MHFCGHIFSKEKWSIQITNEIEDEILSRIGKPGAQV